MNNLYESLHQSDYLYQLGNPTRTVNFSIWDRIIFAIIVCLLIKYILRAIKKDNPKIQENINLFKDYIKQEWKKWRK